MTENGDRDYPVPMVSMTTPFVVTTLRVGTRLEKAEKS